MNDSEKKKVSAVKRKRLKKPQGRVLKLRLFLIGKKLFLILTAAIIFQFVFALGADAGKGAIGASCSVGADCEEGLTCNNLGKCGLLQIEIPEMMEWLLSTTIKKNRS